MKVRSRVVCTFVAILAAAPVNADAPVSVLPIVDFKLTFPWKVWVSSEGHDSTYPSGFRYKLLSVRNADSSTVEFALVREISPDTKIVALHAKGPLANFDDAAAKLIDSFSHKFKVTFQKIDLSEVQTLDDFRTRAMALGWLVDANANGQ